MNTTKAIIKIHMARRNVTQKKIAKCFGVSERTWRGWLSDPDEHLTVYRLRVLKEVLKLTDADVMQIVG